jgi:hypothetical protein
MQTLTLTVNGTKYSVTTAYQLREVLVNNKLFVVDATDNVMSDLHELAKDITAYLRELKPAKQIVVGHVSTPSIAGFTDVYIGRATVGGRPFRTPNNWIGSGEFGNMTYTINNYQPSAEQIEMLRSIGDKLLLRCFCHKTPVTEFDKKPVCHGEVMAKYLLA